MVSSRVLLSFVLVSLVEDLVHSEEEPTVNVDLDEQWTHFKSKFNKKHAGAIDKHRRHIWEENVKHIQKHNLEYDLGKHTFRVGLNKFADMTNEEFRSIYLNSTFVKVTAASNLNSPSLSLTSVPSTVDWRNLNYVTPVKDQGECGCCWSFSSAGALEGQFFKKTGKLTSLSEQQLIDCSSSFGNNGCNGGLMDNAFRYVKTYGIESDAVYPYTASVGQCAYSQSKTVGTCTGFVDITRGSESALQTAVASIGPISVGIDASNLSFQLYQSGVYNEAQCSTVDLDHGVLVVGYGSSNGQNYWIVKNSWGTGWGISGYILMSKDANNQCGIATMASYPTV